MFFLNLYFTDGIVQYEEKIHTISMPVKEFGEILNLPHEDIILDPEDKEYNYYHKIVASSLMKIPTPFIPNPFTVGYIEPDSHMIHHMINHITFPRKRNFGLKTEVDVEAIWIIDDKIMLNQAYQVIKYITGRNKEEVILPYKNMIIKILEHTGFNFEE
ncbi:hypothetical protein RYX36_034126 [Vicia faba]